MTTPVLFERQRATLAAIRGTLVPSVPPEDDPNEGTDLVAGAMLQL